MADEDAIKREREQWETANPEPEWIKANIDSVVSRHSFSTTCKAAIPHFYKNDRSGDAAYDAYIADGGDGDNIIAVSAGERHATTLRGKPAMTMFVLGCTADVDGYKTSAPIDDVLEYEYETAMATAVYQETIEAPGGLMDSVSATAGEFAECAKHYSSSAATLNRLIDEFWVEAATNLFAGSVPTGAIYDGTTGGHYAKDNSYTTNAGQKTGAQLSSLYASDRRTAGSAPEWALADTYDAAATPVLGKGPANFDNLIIAEPNQLKLPETISTTGTTSTTAGTVSVAIDGNNVSAFPFYYASFLAAYVNAVKWLATSGPTPQQIRALEQQAAGSIQALSAQNNSQGKIHWNEDPNVLGTPWGLITFFDQWATPANSTYSFNTEPTTPTSGMQFAGARDYSLDGLAQLAKDSATSIPGFYTGVNQSTANELKNWILEKISGIKSVADIVAEASKCMREAKKSMDQEIENEADEFKKALEDTGGLSWNPKNWFADKSLNAALENATASIPIDLDAVLGGSAESVIFRQQCFLLSYVGRIAAYKKHVLESVVSERSKITKKIPYKGLPYNTDEDNTLARTTNSTLLVDGDPYGFINRLTQSPAYSTFFDIENWELSGLQPRIRLFKVIHDEMDEEREVEMKFDSHFSEKEMEFFKSRGARGAGVGLKSFNFTYDGSNQFAAKKSIKATLKITAASFQELFEPRSGEAIGLGPGYAPKPYGNATYRYADLALKTLFKEREDGTATKWDLILDENANLAKLNFRLKAVVGWSKPQGGLPGTNAENIRQAAAESFVTLNLTPTVHNFDFDEQGRVTFTINYLAYVEDFFDQKGFNAFADPTGKISLAREIRELRMKKYTKNCTDEHQEALQEQQKEYAEIAHAEQRTSVKSIIRNLTEQKKIYYINADKETIRNFVSSGPYSDVGPTFFAAGNNFVYNSTDHDEQVKRDIAEALAPAGGGSGGYGAGANTDEELNQIRAALVQVNPDKSYLPFFYVSDLIDVILSNIQQELQSLSVKLPAVKTDFDVLMTVERENLDRRISLIKKHIRNFKRLRIMLGPVELKRYGQSHGSTLASNRMASEKGDNSLLIPDTDSTSFVNFGDLPISVSYFVEFLAEKVFKTDSSFYPLTRMLNELFNDLIDSFLNSKSCFSFDVSQKVRVNQNVLTSYSPTSFSDEITDLILGKLETIYGTYDPTSATHVGQPARLNLNDAIVKTKIYDQRRPILNISGKANEEGSTYAPLSNEKNYLVFFAARTRPADKMTGNKDTDGDGGVFHYLLGRNKGIVKHIKLQKTQTPGLQEVRFEQEGYDGLEQLRVVYDAEIECYANVNAFPGTYIYIPPEGFDTATNMDMTKYGVGGYYMVYRSTHNFAAGDASTKIYAKWVAQLETEADNEAQTRTSPDPTKCGLHRSSASRK